MDPRVRAAIEAAVAGRKVLVAAKCAESTTTERGEIVPNRSALRGSNIWLSLK